MNFVSALAPFSASIVGRVGLLGLVDLNKVGVAWIELLPENKGKMSESAGSITGQ